MIQEQMRDSKIRAQLEFLHPLKGLGEPEDIANTAVYLISDDCSWVTGVTIPVDGGYTAV